MGADFSTRLCVNLRLRNFLFDGAGDACDQPIPEANGRDRARKAILLQGTLIICERVHRRKSPLELFIPGRPA